MNSIGSEFNYNDKLAVFYQGQGELHVYSALAKRLNVPLYRSISSKDTPESYFLTWRDGRLKLLDKELIKKGGLAVGIEPRQGEQYS